MSSVAESAIRAEPEARPSSAAPIGGQEHAGGAPGGGADRDRRENAKRDALRDMGAMLPAAVLALGCLAFVLFSNRSPTRMQLELSWAAPSALLPFGAGEGGVDLLALVVHASARALALAAIVSLFGLAVGTTVGTAAGLARGAVGRAVLGACDLVQSFPSFLLALAILSVVRAPSRVHIGFVFALTVWAPFARLSLVQARVLAEAQFVDAARALGARPSRVALRHVLPNLFGPVAVQLGTSAAAIVLGETALGFVGLGPRDGVSLGAVLEQGTVAMLRAPHVLVVGAIAVALLSGALQLASEGVRARFGLRGTDGA